MTSAAHSIDNILLSSPRSFKRYEGVLSPTEMYDEKENNKTEVKSNDSENEIVVEKSSSINSKYYKRMLDLLPSVDDILSESKVESIKCERVSAISSVCQRIKHLVSHVMIPGEIPNTELEQEEYVVNIVFKLTTLIKDVTESDKYKDLLGKYDKRKEKILLLQSENELLKNKILTIRNNTDLGEIENVDKGKHTERGQNLDKIKKLIDRRKIDYLYRDYEVDFHIPPRFKRKRCLTPLKKISKECSEKSDSVTEYNAAISHESKTETSSYTSSSVETPTDDSSQIYILRAKTKEPVVTKIEKSDNKEGSNANETNKKTEKKSKKSKRRENDIVISNSGNLTMESLYRLHSSLKLKESEFSSD